MPYAVPLELRLTSVSSSTDGLDRVALHAFMERVQATLGHDLRTPLGTIVNYASVLEEDVGLDGERRSELPRRIRGQAMQAAEMLQLLLDATLLAAAVPIVVRVDPDALLRSVVAELEGDAPEPDAAPSPGSRAIGLDPRVVGFAWRSFLALERTLTSRPLSAARTTIDAVDGRVRLELAFGGADAESAAPIDVEAFTRQNAAEIPAPSRFALRLSRDLVRARGGELLVRGRVGADAAIRIDLPRAP
jgi:signal transduction histidine kinase